DLEESDVVVLVGSNMCIAHPILWERLLHNRRRPRIIVIDPRKTETAMAATKHYAIKPKSDLTLFTGLLNLVIKHGGVDERFVAEHTVGFEALAEHAREFEPEKVSAVTGLSVEQLGEFANTIARSDRGSFWGTM